MLDLAPLAAAFDALPAATQRHVDALLRMAMTQAGLEPPPPPAAPIAPSSPLPACAHRGALLDRCQCGDPLRDVWECREPGMLAPGGGPGKATGRLCAGCKRAAP